jgi:two-component system CheB/CheR fusion protein
VCIDTIRTLFSDAVQQANSVSLGKPMAMAPAVVDNKGDLPEILGPLSGEMGWWEMPPRRREEVLAAWSTPSYHPGSEACLLVDTYLPGMSGVELLQHLSQSSHRLPAIMMTAMAMCRWRSKP